ncbi:epididymal protein 13 [Sciurus carolinensis]|uniref:epididymal protein 13 n=1 Tax=Sciurus carolinensis TaxID=30640 RepID=UPI001FB282CE|nr:epididymal protein 13 [Sciurus carolinensis]
MCHLEPVLKMSPVFLLFLGLAEACIPREVAIEEKIKLLKGIVGLMSRLSPDGLRHINPSKMLPLAPPQGQHQHPTGSPAPRSTQNYPHPFPALQRLRRLFLDVETARPHLAESPWLLEEARLQQGMRLHQQRQPCAAGLAGISSSACDESRCLSAWSRARGLTPVSLFALHLRWNLAAFPPQTGPKKKMQTQGQTEAASPAAGPGEQTQPDPKVRGRLTSDWDFPSSSWPISHGLNTVLCPWTTLASGRTEILGLLSLQVLNEETSDCKEEVKPAMATVLPKKLTPKKNNWNFLRCAYMMMTFLFVSYNKGDWCYCHYCNPELDARNDPCCAF